MTFREVETAEWRTGTVENISQSGVLFHATEGLPHDTDAEMVFEMPEEVTGQPSSRVLCTGYIVREGSRRGSPAVPTLASAISGYTFLDGKTTTKTTP